MADFTLDDLFPPSKPPVANAPLSFKTSRPAGRPKKPPPPEVDAELGLLSDDMPHVSAFLKPVGITFLAQIMGKQPPQIVKRLARCPIKEWHEVRGKKAPLYDFMTAMSYLVPPKGNIEEIFAQNNAASLPPIVNKMFWDSAMQRNRVMLSANQLWHTDDVMFIFGRVQIEIQQQVKMWIEDLPGKDLLSDRQYAALTDASNKLIDNIREALVALPANTPSPTGPMTHTILDELESAGGLGMAPAQAPDDE